MELSLEAEEIFKRDGKRRRIRVEVLAFGENNTILAGKLKTTHGVFYDLPGGGIDAGETVVQAGLRELAEEAGWLVKDVHKLNTSKSFVFDGDTPWLKKKGFDQEETRYIVAKPIKFSPDEQYGKEGDNLDFSLVPIDEFIEDMLWNIEKCPKPNVKAFLGFRMVALKLLRNLEKGKPLWLEW